MNQLGLFSGIGGFEESFRRAGATLSAVCEIDPKCQAVLRRHFPEVEIIKDVKDVTKEKHPVRPDVITGGFPCQDLSVAGRRAGLDGERSGLWFEMLRVIEGYKPRWVVIENVPGLLSSSGGRDFAVILQGLVKCGYGIAWRVLDAQYFGLAQRRQRVFIVASYQSGCAAEVLFERESRLWDFTPSREAGERVASTITESIMRSGGATAGNNEMPVNLVGFGLIGNGEYASRPSTIRSKGGDCGGGSEHLIAGTLNAGAHASGFNGQDAYAHHLIAHTLRAEGFDASEDGTGRGTPLVVAATLNSGGNNGGFRSEPGEHLVTIRTAQTGSNGCGIDTSGTSYTLDGSANQVVAFTERSRADGRTFEAQEDLAYSLTDSSKGGNPHSGKIAGGFGVRRLMPVECEILQGFPEGWTETGIDEKGNNISLSDSARYRMLGNAVAVPVVEWIARRIVSMG